MEPQDLSASSVSSVVTFNEEKPPNDEEMKSEGGDTDEDQGQRVYLHIYDYETKAFSSITTYHGLVRIYNSHTWPSRIFWIVVVLSALIMFMIHSGTLLWSYHQRPTLTQVNIVVPDKGILFPDMTICNFNPVVRSKVASWNMSEEVLSYVLKAYLEVGSLQQIVESDEQMQREHNMYINYTIEYKKRTGIDFDLLTFFNSTGHECSDMVLACSWAGKEVEECCNFAVHVMTDLGKCIRFSSFGDTETMQYQKISGAYYGFHILLDILLDERNNHSSTSFMDAGVKFFIHPEGVLPFLQSSGVAAPPGQKIYGAISLRNITLLPTDQWGFCTDQWNEGVHGETLTDQQYSAAHCEANCIANAFKKKCGCVPISKQLNGGQKVCTPFELYNCTKGDSLNLEGGVDDEVYWYSTCGCGVECNRLEYNVEASYSAIISEHPHLQGQGQNLSYIQDNYLAVNVFMKEIAYEEHTQMKQIQTADLLSNIAGSMGLFLGMSTVTLLEIFIYLFKSIWGAVNSDRQKQFEEKQRKLREEMHAKLPAVEDQLSENTESTSSSVQRIPKIEVNYEEKGGSPRQINRRPTRTVVFETRPSRAGNMIERKPTPSGYDYQRRNEKDTSNNDIHLAIINPRPGGPSGGRPRSNSTVIA